MSVAELLPLTTRETPATTAELAEVVRAAGAERTPVYPLGGETSLDYGLNPRRAGIGLSLSNMQRVIDYPARDMTITVEAGLRMQDLAATLAAEGQRLPIDVALPEQATLGGAVAVAAGGSRRVGHGLLRDYVIGITAVDGRGVIFHGGGRVVKNVAGYDFCKLLTGSLGTLAVITEITFKVRPLPEASAFAVCAPRDLRHAMEMLTAVRRSPLTPTSVDLVCGPAWREHSALGTLPAERGWLLLGLEGTREEVAWMQRELERPLFDGAPPWQAVGDPARVQALWNELRDFAAQPAALVLKINVVPSAVAGAISALRELDPEVSLLAHAANGIVLARFAQFPAQQLAQSVIGKLHPLTRAARGNVVLLRSTAGSERTRQVVWGAATADRPLMARVKQQFDPHNLLNPGRFLFEG